VKDGAVIIDGAWEPYCLIEDEDGFENDPEYPTGSSS
jgi:hypothetical protein